MIPDFDLSGVLPPFISSPADPSSKSPYVSNIEEFCLKFSTSAHRISLLKGLLSYRKMLSHIGITSGFQWLDGSFLENIEKNEARNPKDIDVVTFFHRPASFNDEVAWKNFFTSNQNAFSPKSNKINFNCDAYPVDLGIPAEAIVYHTHYWFGLFSHKRSTQQWKGIVQIPLETTRDEISLAYLESLVMP